MIETFCPGTKYPFYSGEEVRPLALKSLLFRDRELAVYSLDHIVLVHGYGRYLVDIYCNDIEVMMWIHSHLHICKMVADHRVIFITITGHFSFTNILTTYLSEWVALRSCQ